MVFVNTIFNSANSQTDFHNENKLISHLVISDLRIILMNLAQVKTRLLKSDYVLFN